jgi:hypothetical protein
MALPFTSATASSWYACRKKVARSGRFSEELIYPAGNAKCSIPPRFYNVTVVTQAGGGIKAELKTINNGTSGEVTNFVYGTTASNKVMGSHQASPSATACVFEYTIISGACFLSDKPTSSAATKHVAAATTSLVVFVSAVAALLV